MMLDSTRRVRHVQLFALCATVAACGGGDDSASPDPALTASVAFTAPGSLADNLTGTLQITANATDDDGVANVEFQVDGVTVATDTTSPYAATVDTSLYASGQHVLRVRATDAAGNASDWVSRTVRFGGSRAAPSGFTRNENFVTA